MLFRGKELENVASLVLHFRDARTWQRAGNCCIFGTSFSGYLLVFGYFCCFLACDHALLQVLRCSQPTPSNSSVLLILIILNTLDIWRNTCSNAMPCHLIFFVYAVYGRFKSLKGFGFAATSFGTWLVQTYQRLWFPRHFLWSLTMSSMHPYQTTTDKAIWLTFDLFTELVHKKIQEKQIELLDLKGNPLPEEQFIQIQWDARVARRTTNLCEERLITLIDYLA